MRLVNGYPCRNCADEELAKRGIDPAHPNRKLEGSEAFANPADDDERRRRLGENVPTPFGSLGRRLDVLA